MQFKKNLLSYFLWFIYTGLVILAAIGFGRTLANFYCYPDLVGIIACPALVLLFGILTIFIRMLWINKTADSNKVENDSQRFMIWPEIVYISLILVYGIYLRYISLDNIIDNNLFEISKVMSDWSAPGLLNMAKYLYVNFLHLVFWLLGNKLIAGIWLQIAFQIISAVLLYLSVRKLGGVIAASISLLILMVSNLYVKSCMELNVGIFVMLMYSLVLFVCVYAIKPKAHPILIAFSGFITGLFIYTDVIGFTLFAFAVFGIIFVNFQKKDGYTKRLPAIVLYVIFAILGFVSLLFGFSLYYSDSFINIFYKWVGMFGPAKFSLSISAGGLFTVYEVVIILLLLGMGIFSFWFGYKVERKGIWMVAFIVQLVLICFGMFSDQSDGYIFIYFVISVLAGLGLSDIVLPKRVLIKNDEEQAIESNIVIETDTRNDVENKEIHAEQVENKPNIEFIKNPLPVPKKHEKKILDYDIKDITDSDDFDYQISENDDYDLP